MRPPRDIQSERLESRRSSRCLWSLPSHNERCGGNGFHRRRDCALSTLSSRKQPLLGRWRRAPRLYRMPRPAPAARPRSGGLRREVPGLPRYSASGQDLERPFWQALSRWKERLRYLSYAAGGPSEHARTVHRPPHSYCEARPALPGLTTWRKVSNLISGSYPERNVAVFRQGRRSFSSSNDDGFACDGIYYLFQGNRCAQRGLLPNAIKLEKENAVST